MRYEWGVIYVGPAATRGQSPLRYGGRARAAARGQRNLSDRRGRSRGAQVLEKERGLVQRGYRGRDANAPPDHLDVGIDAGIQSYTVGIGEHVVRPGHPGVAHAFREALLPDGRGWLKPLPFLNFGAVWMAPGQF